MFWRTSRNRGLSRALAVVMVCATALPVAGCAGNPAPNLAAGLPAALSAAGPLLKSLGVAVPGLSQAQAILGAGSLLGLAKGKMPADQFGQLSSAIPGADALIGEAVKQGLPSSLSGLSGLTDFLGKSGLSAAQLGQMVPVLTGAVQGKVSPELATSFASALK